MEDLEILGIVGFDGVTKHGLQIHPDQRHIIYSMGNKITIKNLDYDKQDFLSGHTDIITTLCISSCGSFIASGQITHPGFKAAVIIWDFEKKKLHGSYEIHKVKVEDVCFTINGNFLISLGGKDDGSIVIYDVYNNSAICGSYGSTKISGNAMAIATMKQHNLCFLSSGDNTLKLWHLNSENRKLTSVNVKVGKLRRTINCLAIDDKDNEAYCGTSTGDIIRIKLNFTNDVTTLQPPVMIGCYSKISKDQKKQKCGDGDLYSGGITRILIMGNKKIIVATGDGTIELVDVLDSPPVPSTSPVKLPTTPQLKTIKSTNVRGAVTSLIRYEKNCFIIGTSFSEIYKIGLTHFDAKVVITCHVDAVYDVAFPQNYPEIFATGSKNDIRLWQLKSHKELLRITVPNFSCTSLCFSYDGKLILSAWNDGIVRAFKPQSGQLFYSIENAHVKAVSAIGLTKNGKTLVTGGYDGQVRIWQVSKDIQRLCAFFKEQRGPITALHISSNDEEVVSASTDGTCIIWDLQECTRKQVLMGNTMHMSVKFCPNGLQILSCGADRKVSYWETYDGSLLREVEGSTVGSINSLDISPDGRHFVTGSSDCLVRFWDYHTADVTHVGTGHAAIVTACKFSPDSLHIVTASADGTVIIWNSPIVLQLDSAKSSKSSKSSHSDAKSIRSVKGEENVGNVSRRSSDQDSIRTVHKSKKCPEDCEEYDPIKTAQQSFRSQKDKELQPSVNQEIHCLEKKLINSSRLSVNSPGEKKSANKELLVLATTSHK